MSANRGVSLSLLAVVVMLGGAGGAAAVPAVLTHQGVVAVGGARFTGPGAFRFALVHADTNAYLWVNDGSVVVHPVAPTNAVSLTVVNGAYNVRLGDNAVPNMTGIPLSLFNANDRVVLRVWFDDLRGHGVRVLAPDLPVVTVPFSQYAAVSGSVNIPGTNTGAVVVAGTGDVKVPAGLDVAGPVTGVGFGAWDTVAANDVTTGTVFSGDVSGVYNATVVGDDSHTHGDSTVADAITINNGVLFAPSFGGNVGIGTIAPTRRLQIVGGDLQFENTSDFGRSIGNAYDLQFILDTDNDSTDAWFRVGTNNFAVEQLRIVDGDEASILGDGSFVSNGLDYAEAFKVLDGEGDLEAGDVVSLAVGQWEYCRRTVTGYDAQLLGVVSERPGFVCGMSFDAEEAIDPALTATRNDAFARHDSVEAKRITMEMGARMAAAHRPIALTGRVPCKVDGARGRIRAGDRLTSSATPGHAMVQTRAGQSIGIALEDWADASRGSVMVLVQPGWHEPAGPSSPGVEATSPSVEVFEGTDVLDENGSVWVTLPATSAVDAAAYGYQLTPVGGAAALYVAERVRDGKFRIAGGTPGLEVSWQVRRSVR
ncbi:MAG: hypothetical protein HOP29_16400 [Phycisphaerales bacterium]|nr:hypothetical protein [Phycisphaerales bacterium]